MRQLSHLERLISRLHDTVIEQYGNLTSFATHRPVWAAMLLDIQHSAMHAEERPFAALTVIDSAEKAAFIEWLRHFPPLNPILVRCAFTPSFANANIDSGLVKDLLAARHSFLQRAGWGDIEIVHLQFGTCDSDDEHLPRCA